MRDTLSRVIEVARLELLAEQIFRAESWSELLATLPNALLDVRN